MIAQTRRRTLFVLALLGASAPVFAQDVVNVTDFSGAPGNGLYSFASTTPALVLDLIQQNRPRPAATARGQLLMPGNVPSSAKVPAVVLVHGSGGVYPEEITYWARLLNEQGIAAFVIDIFGARGVKSTAEDQRLVPFAADTADAFAALELLSTHPRIDPKRIAVMGFSRGGITAVRSGVQKIIKGATPAGLRFAAHVAVYSGGCAGVLSVTAKPGVFGPEPMLFVHGDADDYAYVSDCRSYAQRISSAGTPTEFVALPGARHKFDADSTRLINARRNPKTREGCPLEFDVMDMAIRDRRTGDVVPQDRVKAVLDELCAATGAMLQGDADARDAAGKAVIAFLNKVFKR